MKKIVILFLVLAVLVAGCTPAAQATDLEKENLKLIVDGGLGRGTYRLTDEEAGVVCYVFMGYQRGGISCLPISETNLEVQ